METSDYENPWIFNSKPFTSEDIGSFLGFVYVITQKSTGKKYIGRKYFWHYKRVKGKKNRVKYESDWKKYYGSSKELLAIIKECGYNDFERVILSLHTTKGDVNYEEVKQQFKEDVLEDDKYFNDNINGKWYRKPAHISDGRLINEDYRLGKRT